MFILRKITKAGKQINFDLGSDYNFIHSEHNSEDFKSSVKAFNLDIEDIYGLIVYADGGKFQCLFKGQYNYIMTDTGKTFDRLK